MMTQWPRADSTIRNSESLHTPMPLWHYNTKTDELFVILPKTSPELHFLDLPLCVVPLT